MRTNVIASKNGKIQTKISVFQASCKESLLYIHKSYDLKGMNSSMFDRRPYNPTSYTLYPNITNIFRSRQITDP